MRWPRLRFSVRAMMAAVAVVALVMGAVVFCYDRYVSVGVNKAYFVGDLIPEEDREKIGDALPALGKQFQASVTPDVWWSPRRRVTPFFMSQSLIIRHSESGHRQIAAWLQGQRASQRVRSGRSADPINRTATP